MIEQGDVMGVKEAAALIGIAPGTLRARVRDGSLPAPIVLGRRRLYMRSELEEALKKLRGGKSEAAV